MLRDVVHAIAVWVVLCAAALIVGENVGRVLNWWVANRG